VRDIPIQVYTYIFQALPVLLQLVPPLPALQQQQPANASQGRSKSVRSPFSFKPHFDFFTFRDLIRVELLQPRKK
jgi:hypothetical protein